MISPPTAVTSFSHFNPVFAHDTFASGSNVLDTQGATHVAQTAAKRAYNTVGTDWVKWNTLGKDKELLGSAIQGQES